MIVAHHISRDVPKPVGGAKLPAGNFVWWVSLLLWRVGSGWRGVPPEAGETPRTRFFWWAGGIEGGWYSRVDTSKGLRAGFSGDARVASASRDGTAEEGANRPGRRTRATVNTIPTNIAARRGVGTKGAK